MELLSVIRRWHCRDHFSIREISRRTGLSRNTVRKYLRSDTVEPKFSIPDRPSKLDPYADKLSQMLRQEAGKSASRSERPSNCTPIWPPSATTAPTIAWRRSRATGRPLGNRNRRRAAAACSCRWRFCRARRSSSTGRKIGRSSAASGPNCRSLTSSSPTAAPSSSGPTRSKLTRCCSTPITTPSACWAAFPGEASMTICEPPWTRSGAARSARSTRASQPWSATSCSRRSSAIRLPAGRRGRSRRTSRTRAIGSGSPCRTSPL